jgi:hypothetical protein
MLTILAEIDDQVFTPQRISVMRAWGIATKPLWQWLGIAAEPTLEAVADWRSARLAEIAAAEAEEARRQAYAAVRNWATQITGRALSKISQHADAGSDPPTQAAILASLGGE